MLRYGLSAFFMAALALLASTRPAWAYIDFGTGSMVFQMLMAGAIGVFFTIKMYWFAFKRKIHVFWSRLTGRPVPPDSEAKPDGDAKR